jgi:protein KRI1
MMQMVKSEKSGASAVLGEVPKRKVDEEDEARENDMDEYEKKYNFRFEDPNAATITSHARDAGVEESLRRPDDARKLARERAKERKEDLKN